MSAPKNLDLTRWNRAGLSRFEYVDGNAATFLEQLREELAKEGRFEDKWSALTRAVPLEVEEDAIGYEREEQLRKRSEQLLAQYQGERRDWAWEITRSFARASHILAGYINAYANEGFIGTATQWDNVRRMVEMLDYHPAPPASASTRLALIPKENMSGMVAKGFQVKHSPVTGGPSAIFETLEDLQMDSALNELRIEGWDRSEKQVDSIQWCARKNPIGDIAMVVHEAAEEATAAGIDSFDALSKEVTFSFREGAGDWDTWHASDVDVLISPRWKRKCLLNESDVIRTVEPHGLGKGSYIGWNVPNPVDPSGEDVWKFAKVTKADKWTLKLDMDATGVPPGPTTKIYEAGKVVSNVMAADLEAVGMSDLAGPPLTTGKKVGESVIPESGEVPPDLSRPFKLPEHGYNPPPDTSTFPPPGKLSFGSFLFPTPMLPMDLVKVAVDLMLSMGAMVIPSTGEIVFKALPDITMPSAGDLLALMEAMVGSPSQIEWPGLGTTPSQAAKQGALQVLLDEIEPVSKMPVDVFKEIEAVIDEENPLITIQRSASVKAVVAPSATKYIFNGKPDKIGFGDRVVGQLEDDSLKAFQVIGVEIIEPDRDGTETFALTFEAPPADPGPLKKVYADFRDKIIAKDIEINESQISANDGLEKDVSEVLRKGQYVILTANGKKAFPAKVVRINDKTIITDPSIDGLGFTKGELVILGNVVLAGHGETMPEKILGSGDAAQSNQSFIFSVEGVSFIADETKSAGVAADIDVIVDGQIWEQVSSLNDSGPTDIHYSVHMTEEGFLKINFGDGEHGRRLPSGSNNVRISYREGSGLAGNIPAGGLEKAVKPHRVVESVLQPLNATGGNDMEDVASLRENAPASLLTLDRAVSLVDFENLAASDSRIWQAKAFSRASVLNRHENVEVVIVPAGGGELGDLAPEIKKSLQSKALPGVIVTVSKYSEIPLDLDVTIKVKEDEYNPEMVIDEVKTALLDTFSLRRSQLGEHLYLSRVYQVVENVEGVERSICIIDGNSDLRMKKANSDHLIYLAGDELPPNVGHKAYEL